MDTTPISWRGLMVTKAMHQLLHSVSASRSAMSCGVDTITAPSMMTSWLIVSCTSPVPGGCATWHISPVHSAGLRLAYSHMVITTTTCTARTTVSHQGKPLASHCAQHSPPQQPSASHDQHPRTPGHRECPQCGTQTRIFSHGDNHHHVHGENHGVVAECKRFRATCSATPRKASRLALRSTLSSATTVGIPRSAEQVARKIGLDWH
jgi:ATP-binding protein involved in chromosome partitioning